MPVYFIGADFGPIKVGHSQKPRKRLGALQTGNPYELRVLHLDYDNDEWHWHNKLAKYRIRGEWFLRSGVCKYVPSIPNNIADKTEQELLYEEIVKEKIEEVVDLNLRMALLEEENVSLKARARHATEQYLHARATIANGGKDPGDRWGKMLNLARGIRE